MNTGKLLELRAVIEKESPGFIEAVDFVINNGLQGIPLVIRLKQFNSKIYVISAIEYANAQGISLCFIPDNSNLLPQSN
jgi:hypothetical protein